MFNKLFKLIKLGFSIDDWFLSLALENKTKIFNWYSTKDDLEILSLAYQK